LTLVVTIENGERQCLVVVSGEQKQAIAFAVMISAFFCTLQRRLWFSIV